MPFDEALLSLFRTRRFWLDYFWLEEDGNAYDRWQERSIALPLAGAYGLLLRLAKGLSEVTLYLTHRSISAPVQLGWHDQIHWHPHVFRWDECELICRCLARLNPEMPHPGWPLLLIYRFAPIVRADDHAAARSRISEAWRTLGLFSEDLIDQFLEYGDLTEYECDWVRDPEYGWILEGEGAYTMRNADNPDFPFELLKGLLDESRKGETGPEKAPVKTGKE